MKNIFDILPVYLWHMDVSEGDFWNFFRFLSRDQRTEGKFVVFSLSSHSLFIDNGSLEAYSSSISLLSWFAVWFIAI
jgi:hypothetical protein